MTPGMENPLAGITPEQDAAERAQAARAAKEEKLKKQDELEVSYVIGKAEEEDAEAKREAKRMEQVEASIMARVDDLKKQAETNPDPLGLAVRSYEEAKKELDEFRRKGELKIN
jgi:hypothetical protein